MARPPLKSKGFIHRISVSTSPEAEDAVGELMSTRLRLPASAYTDFENGTTRVDVYATKPPAKRAMSCLKQDLETLQQCGFNTGSLHISVQKTRKEDWAESWKHHFKPIVIGRSLLIQPSWSKRKPYKNQACIVLDPGLSFGTGHHATTSFCLEQLVNATAQSAARTPESLPLSLIDIGTGSGILAIAAAKLGYAPITAFDFDPAAVKVARENALSNGLRLGKDLDISRRDLTALPRSMFKRQYDVVCANLIYDLLNQQRDTILALLKPGGILVLAGILETQFNAVQSCYQAKDALVRLKLVDHKIEKEWRSGAFQSVVPSGIKDQLTTPPRSHSRPRSRQTDRRK